MLTIHFISDFYCCLLTEGVLVFFWFFFDHLEVKIIQTFSFTKLCLHGHLQGMYCTTVTALST